MLPQRRGWKIAFCSVKECEATVYVNGQPVNTETDYDENRNRLTVVIPATDIAKPITVSFDEPLEITDNRKARLYEVLERAQMSYNLKEKIWKEICKSEVREAVDLNAFEIDRNVKDCLNEFLK